jgi:hypothetical protein
LYDCSPQGYPDIRTPGLTDVEIGQLEWINTTYREQIAASGQNGCTFLTRDKRSIFDRWMATIKAKVFKALYGKDLAVKRRAKAAREDDSVENNSAFDEEEEGEDPQDAPLPRGRHAIKGAGAPKAATGRQPNGADDTEDQDDGYSSRYACVLIIFSQIANLTPPLHQVR